MSATGTPSYAEIMARIDRLPRDLWFEYGMELGRDEAFVMQGRAARAAGVTAQLEAATADLYLYQARNEERAAEAALEVALAAAEDALPADAPFDAIDPRDPRFDAENDALFVAVRRRRILAAALD